MKALYVHIGLPRAGSTFFQERVFTGKEGIQYLGKNHADYPEWLMHWHYLSEFEFCAQSDRIRDCVSNLQSSRLPNVLSSEMFTMWGGRTSEQARRLHALFPQAKIVMVLREPVSRMVSFYKAIVERDGFFMPLKKMIDWKELPFVDYKRKPIQVADFKYDLMADAYRSFFGADQVCVLRLEDMKDSPRDFWGKLSDFMSVDFGEREIELSKDATVNASPSSEKLGDLRWENLRGLLGETQIDLGSLQGNSFRAGWDKEELVSSSLRKRLVDSLRSRCGFYYA